MTRTSTNPIDQDPGPDRSLALYGVVFGAVGSLGILFFWIIAAILLGTRNGGFITDLALDGLWLTGFWAYPFVALAAVATGAILFIAKRDREAVGAAGLPVGLTAVFYLALTLFG